jgi:aubergine-like protein
MVFLNMSNYDNRRALDEIAKAVEKAKKEECNICMVVIPNQMKTQYKTVKEICLVDKKIISQVVVESTLRKGGIKSIATKILLQLIVKRGNVLWAPKEVEHTMLIAFDTAKCGRKNIVCGVSTRDKTFSSLCSKVEEYDDINSKLNACAMMIMRLIDAYIKSREIPPK